MIRQFFIWDDEKNASNIRKHDLDFDTASRVFNDPLRQSFESFCPPGATKEETAL
jgi:uncharacterized DUF497 family protein